MTNLLVYYLIIKVIYIKLLLIIRLIFINIEFVIFIKANYIYDSSAKSKKEIKPN